MKYLVGIPCLYGVGHTKDAIESVINHADLLLIDNGAEQPVKELINTYSEKSNVKVIHNKENIYVNPAWNQIIGYFINSDCDYLLIMNSDLILQKDWKELLDFYFNHDPELIPIPLIEDDLRSYNRDIKIEIKHKEVFGGVPGVLIILNKKMAEKIFPIPDYIKIWFGDNWIYEILRKWYHTVIVDNLICYHSGSQNIQRLREATVIIEQDKKEWYLKAEADKIKVWERFK